MTLQWTIIAAVLYFEIGLTFILLLPWIRPSLWSKLFKSRLISAVSHNAHVYSYAGAFVLFILFADAVREVHKYGAADTLIDASIRHTADADAIIHMRLFRAQRNFYISGFALLLFLVIKRIISLISRGAQLEAASEAAMRQAESASKTAKSLMNAGGEGEVADLNRKIKELGEELKKAQVDRDTIKKQAEGLQKEYDRVADELNAKAGGDSNKKDD